MKHHHPSNSKKLITLGSSQITREQSRAEHTHDPPVLDAELDAEGDVGAAGGLHDGEVLGGVVRHERERAHPGVPHQRAQLAEAELPVRRRGLLHGRLQVRPGPEEVEQPHLRGAVPAAEVRRQRRGHVGAALDAPRARVEGQLRRVRLIGGTEEVQGEAAEAPHRRGLFYRHGIVFNGAGAGAGGGGGGWRHGAAEVFDEIGRGVRKRRLAREGKPGGSGCRYGKAVTINNAVSQSPRAYDGLVRANFWYFVWTLASRFPVDLHFRFSPFTGPAYKYVSVEG